MKNLKTTIKSVATRLKQSEKFQQFIKRLKSLIWRGSNVALIYLASFMAEELTSLEIDGIWKIVAGLLAGELTKYINRKKNK